MDFTNFETNSVCIRVERAYLGKDLNALNNEAELKILGNEFFKQHIDDFHKIDYTASIKTNSFKSVKGSKNEPIWATKYQDDYSDGDIWLPLDKDQKKLTIVITSGKFYGEATLDLLNYHSEAKNYELFKVNGTKIDDSYVTLSFSRGTKFEIEFFSGDAHLTPGTGHDVHLLDSIFKNGGVIMSDFYKFLKVFNPFQFGVVDAQKDNDTSVVFQIYGTHFLSRSYLCNKFKINKKNNKISLSYEFFLHERVGFPVAITLRLESANPNSKLTWYVDLVELRSGSFVFKFPCYQWLTERKCKTISLPHGYLPHKIENLSIVENLLQERFNEIEIQKSKYQWSKTAGLPSFLRGTEYGAYDLVPLDEKFDDIKNKDFSYLAAKGAVNIVINSKLKSHFQHLQSLDDYKKLYSLKLTHAVHQPELSKNWLNDDIFGWNFLAGTNPMRFKLCSEIPFQFKNGTYFDVSDKPIDLQIALDESRLYTVNYTGLLKYNLHTIGIQSAPFIQDGRKYSAPCSCLFYVDSSDSKLRPIAIQLLPDGVIFTPKDSFEQWTYAKIAVQNADAQYHQIVDHWLHAHAISEVYSISLNRTVSRIHPIYRLLTPHLKYTISINTLARRGLISSGGIVHQLTSIGDKMNDLLVDGYNDLDFVNLDLPSKLKANGFTLQNKGALKDFPYYDDGLLVWNAMFEFVGEYLNIYYKTDEDVCKDTEVQNWIEEMKTHGFRGKKFPEVLNMTNLKKLITTIIWTTSCHHSAVNFNQYKFYGFVPNKPLALFKKIPTTKEEIDKNFLIDSLPKVIHASTQILILNVLSNYEPHEEYLCSDSYFKFIHDDEAVKCCRKYQQKLIEIDNNIKKINQKRVEDGFFEYELLMPSKVPFSVAI